MKRNNCASHIVLKLVIGTRITTDETFEKYKWIWENWSFCWNWPLSWTKGEVNSKQFCEKLEKKKQSIPPSVGHVLFTPYFRLYMTAKTYLLLAAVQPTFLVRFWVNSYSQGPKPTFSFANLYYKQQPWNNQHGH